MLQDFKQFILRGNTVDLAIGVVIGASFNTVVSSMVKDLVTPLVGIFYKQKNFSTASFTINHSHFLYGDFVNSAISFLIIAAVIFFLVVKPLNKLNDLAARRKPKLPSNDKKCPYCLSVVPKEATKCMYCTSGLKKIVTSNS